MENLLATHPALQQSIEADQELAAQGRLQKACVSFFKQADTDTPRGVVLMLHGWSAGPWQFAPMAEAFAKAGLHSYAARLPGHGACLHDGREDPSFLPRSAQTALFTAAAEAAFERCHALTQSTRLPLFVFGFSVGGAVALELVGLHGRDVSRLILAAPMLRPHGVRPRLIFEVLYAVSRLGGARLYDAIPFSWGPAPVIEPGAWRRPGHWNFKMGNLFAAMSYGRSVYKKSQDVRTPTQLFLTDCDDKSDASTVTRLLRRRTGNHHHVWRFPKSMGVPHAMLTPEENPSAASRQFLYDASIKFLLEGTGSTGTGP